MQHPVVLKIKIKGGKKGKTLLGLGGEDVGVKEREDLVQEGSQDGILPSPWSTAGPQRSLEMLSVPPRGVLECFERNKFAHPLDSRRAFEVC